MRRNRSGPVRAIDEQEQVEMRLLKSQGWTLVRLAEAYGVSTRTVIRYLHTDYPHTDLARTEVVIRRWAKLYAIRIRPNELDALARSIVHSHSLRDPQHRESAA